MKNISAERPPCMICQSASDFLADKDGYAHYQCPQCKLVFVYPLPTAEFLAQEVYSEKSGYQANKKKDLSAILPTAKQEKLLAYLKNSPKGTFLDVGCSSGELLYFVKGIGYDVKGVELNSRTASIATANGLDVRCATVERAGFAENFFDYVHMGDLIEHVLDPVQLLAESKRVLRQKGKLIIITPNMDCFWSHTTKTLFTLFNVPWSSLTPPHHLFDFSYGNLEKLLVDNGFDIETTWYNRTPSLKYELGSLHLVKAIKQARANGSRKELIKVAAFAFISFALYTVIFGVNRLVECLPLKRFGMAVVAVKR
ncbi:MAG TPA: class I SAM-dependent methyltransferase [Candidatus Paceibacterota bacterium]|jgi:SAM-dependent methyltransferase|nr:class I SAM-dependent methyltransferase [Candidatus Paceibacterota bacterium]